MASKRYTHELSSQMPGVGRDALRLIRGSRSSRRMSGSSSLPIIPAYRSLAGSHPSRSGLGKFGEDYRKSPGTRSKQIPDKNDLRPVRTPSARRNNPGGGTRYCCRNRSNSPLGQPSVLSVRSPSPTDPDSTLDGSSPPNP